MKFTIGDKVKVISEDVAGFGKIGVIKKTNNGKNWPYWIDFGDDSGGNCFRDEDLELAEPEFKEGDMVEVSDDGVRWATTRYDCEVGKHRTVSGGLWKYCRKIEKDADLDLVVTIGGKKIVLSALSQETIAALVDAIRESKMIHV